MPDGAHLGVPAGRALETVLGGRDQPSEDERMSDAEFERWVRSAPGMGKPGTEEGYSETARYAARLVLEFLESHPEHQQTPSDPVGEFRVTLDDGSTRLATQEDVMQGRGAWVRTEEGLYEVMDQAGVAIAPLSLTGFMWGWAMNAARRILGLGPVPNPAIVEMG